MYKVAHKGGTEQLSTFKNDRLQSKWIIAVKSGHADHWNTALNIT